MFRALERVAKQMYPGVTVLPSMSTGATDMAYLRAKGIQCYGVGPALDVEDGPKGFGAHSDQERLLESELHRFVRFNWDVVTELAQEAAAFPVEALPVPIQRFVCEGASTMPCPPDFIALSVLAVPP